MIEDDGQTEGGPPVRRVARMTVCENQVWRVFYDHIITDFGSEVPQYLVLEPRVVSGSSIGGIAIVPVVGGRIGLVHTYRHPIGAFHWEAVRGFMNAGETMEAAAMRELNEETGLQCDVGDLIPLGTVSPEPGAISARAALFAAINCRQAGEPLGDEPGLGKMARLSRDEVRQMMRDGRITDASTLVALYRYFDTFSAGA